MNKKLLSNKLNADVEGHIASFLVGGKAMAVYRSIINKEVVFAEALSTAVLSFEAKEKCMSELGWLIEGVRQPYADLLVDGKKTWEICKKKVVAHVGKRVLIFPTGGDAVIIGHASLDECRLVTRKELAANVDKHQIADWETSEYCRGEVLYSWVFRDAQRFDKADGDRGLVLVLLLLLLLLPRLLLAPPALGLAGSGWSGKPRRCICDLARPRVGLDHLAPRGSGRRGHGRPGAPELGPEEDVDDPQKTERRRCMGRRYTTDDTREADAENNCYCDDKLVDRSLDKDGDWVGFCDFFYFFLGSY